MRLFGIWEAFTFMKKLAFNSVFGALLLCSAGSQVALSSGISASAQVEVTCEDIQGAEAMKVLREGKDLTRERWKSIDVIAGFPYDKCKDSVSQDLVKIKGQLIWRFTTEDDSCDGGNSYGAFYTYDLRTPIAHVYDSDVYCGSDWRPEYRSENHRCDLKAEELAVTKMREFGLEFIPLSSDLQLRKPYAYSSIFVEGTLPNKQNRPATVQVLMNLNKCSVGGTSIARIPL